MAVATREPVPMGSVQQPPKAAPSASSSDRPPPHRCERISPVKNRMLEIGTSGTVRGEDGNILTYSALRLEWRGQDGRANVGTAVLEAATRDLVAAANADPRLKGVFTPFSGATPNIYADIDRVKAAKLGLPPERVFEAM